MRFLLIILLGLFASSSTAQTWQSIPRIELDNTVGIFQFSIDPYTNNIWVNAEDQVAVIENDGTIRVFTTASGELATMWWGSELRFAFTPSHTYCASISYGLRSFDNYIAQPEYSFSNYVGGLSSDQDTLFISGVDISGDTRMVMFTEGVIDVEIKGASLMVSKNGYEYAVNSEPCFYIPPFSNITYLYEDSEYLQATYNDVKFTRLTDTLYASGKLGINKVFNYDVFDTITPNNTVNMPSPNVLEMEWDHQDNLWAVFGDAQDDAIAIARLNENVWVDLIDDSNSPIDFSTLYGLEIDTLGNIWVSDFDALHTIITSSSPSWLSTLELTSDNIKVYPNPTKDILHINSEIKEETEFQIIDTYGRSVLVDKLINGSAVIDISTYNSGIYFLTLDNGQNVTKFFKQ
jgi:hypothetical protein